MDKRDNIERQRGTFLFCHKNGKMTKEVMEWEDRQER